MENVNTIIWDWNGTLLNDTELCKNIVNNLLRERGKELLSTERYKEIFNFPVKDYYAKADEMSTDQETHTLKTLSQTLMDVKLPAYTEDSFMCGHASAYLEWYLEGAGFETEIVDGKIHPSDVLHAWTIVKLPEGDVAVEAVYLCEDNYHPPGIIMDPAHKFKDYSTDYQEYLRYLKEYSTGEYILPKNFDDFMKNYIDGATYSNEDYYDSINIYNEYEDIYDATENLLGLDWWENKTLWQ